MGSQNPSQDGFIAGSSSGKRTKASPRQQDCVPVPGASTYANGQAKAEASPCQQDDTSPNLPEDIWHDIHSLMPLKDAARAACLSRSFLSSWRCHSILVLNREAFGLDICADYKETTRTFRSKIDHILGNHSGTGVRILKLRLVSNDKAKDRDYIDKWLHKAVKPGIEELTLTMAMSNKRKYEFPCTLISNGLGNSLRCLYLSNCSFHPMAGHCGLSSLTKLELLRVGIMGDELSCLVSSSAALEQVLLRDCSKVDCLRIPCHLERLSHLKVLRCSELRLIESRAPNLSSFPFNGNLKVRVSLGEALQVKNLLVNSTESICYTRAELVSSTPSREMVSPTIPSKLADLNSLSIYLEEFPFGWGFDCPSLASMFGASFSLETFISHVSNELMQHVLFFEGVVSPRSKSLVELACHVLRAWLS
ncbi:unnamed protein product [Triticum turgidum subsp. durum]|uniref:F-box domain-containing protein n=1 Tax=Triticum turgidum subsp. durum TaxID=4567 RepID=A0A9R1Q427_TRITD|nr:unnamed protein product [Triticum turgidum subsp. durum]